MDEETPTPSSTVTSAGGPAPSGSPYRQRDFRDLDVNPSVPASRAEEDRLSNQAARILALFRSRYPSGTVTTLEMAAISRQYGSRLWEIRRHLVRKGYCVDCVRRGSRGCHHYAVRDFSHSRFFKKHRAQFEAEGLI
jgi:hypothetical protein